MVPPSVVVGGGTTIVAVAFQSIVGQTQYATPSTRLPHVLSMEGLMVRKRSRTIACVRATI